MPDVAAAGIAVPITLMTLASMRQTHHRAPDIRKQSLVATASFFIVLGYAVAGSAYHSYPFLTVVVTCGMLMAAGLYDLYETGTGTHSALPDNASAIGTLLTSLGLTGDAFVTGAFLATFQLPLAKTLGILAISCFGVWLALRTLDADKHLTQHHLRQIGATAFVVSGVVAFVGTLASAQR